MACITGGIAEAYYGLPDDIGAETWTRLDDRLRGVVHDFRARFC